MIEYVLVVSAMALVSAGLFRQMGQRTHNLVQRASNAIAAASSGAHGPSAQAGGGAKRQSRGQFEGPLERPIESSCTPVSSLLQVQRG